MDWLKFSSQCPYVFTEHGAVMLASVLNSKRAIAANIQIVRIFTRMRELLQANGEVLVKLQQLEGQVEQNSEEIKELFFILRELLGSKPPPPKKIGFRRAAEKD